MEAADEIGLAVIATTFTLIAVFLPTAFMSGVPGKFFVQFGWTAAIAVFFSLVVARLLTPMMAAYLLQARSSASTASRRWMRRYMRWVALVPAAPREDDARGGGVLRRLVRRWCRCCRPASSRRTTCRRPRSTLELPPGSTLRADTARAAEQAREIVQQNAHVKLVYTAIGGGSDRRRPVRAGRRAPRCARPR